MTQFAPSSLIVMGVAGSGKSTLAAALAEQLRRPWLEGDQFHSDANRRKMAQGEPLTDEDRASWLATLAEQLRRQPGALVACSALKRAYRDQLRAASPGLRFAFLDIDKSEASRRVSTRAAHFFAASLESPVGEPGVLHLDALKPLAELQDEACDWLRQPPTQAPR
jgi:gluconokinase